ncbi:aldehyde dehydrogenase family protein [Siminovitchia fortis]|uniref:Aldehyde dehydrogenase family protein n=1 Tax=Siminovitchia fortis TaxID=254758 RepID=A0A443IVS5_9BACI|nr:aldehyde dehydrogenase family protein [Siminovitchia fortis]RWR12162.1 aldehyde dehydrogenase family protein [Siminovitchia fortis]WHY81003.1 aldehyde dehydrogenase family protein [Siminovitchia fortis]
MSQEVKLSKKVSDFLSGTKKIFIGGQFVESISGRTFETYNPATGEVLAFVSEAQAEDIDKAVVAAKEAFEHGPWSKMSAAERGRLMYRLAQLIEQHKQELAEIDSLDNGKPMREVIENDIPNAIGQFEYFAGWTTKIIGQTIPVSGPYFNYTRHEPVGVVGQIIPWNFPLMMAAWKIAPALATGCTVVLKPAEQTPLSALYLAELAAEAGFPEGVINVVPGFGETAGAALVKHPDVNKIAFTGSTVVGKSIMKTAADTLKRVTLELGGKSPNIILPDADLTKATPGVFSGIMANQGEVCSAGSRVYIQKNMFDNVVSDLVTYAKNVKLGSGLSPDTDMGPLVSKEQQDRVVGYINRGKSEGAELLCGGSHTEKGYFVEPTVFADVDDTMSIAREEIFGPVVVAMPYDDLDEIIERANATPFGLAAGLWTESLKNAHYVANRLKAGSVWVNCYNLTDPASPFGGYKESGFGREMGSYALDNYIEVKSVWINLN